MEAIARLRPILRARGGALLADEVGLGKTYVALALARSAVRPLVVSPAGLQTMWERACDDAGMIVGWRSIESFSGKARELESWQGGRPDLVIVDEAHHFRNPATHRYQALAAETAGIPLLLLSATPVHNSPGDLAALLALFIGDRAWTLNDEQRARYVVRRSHSIAGTLDEVPDVSIPEWLEVGDDAATLAEIMALPPPVPPSDSGDGGALLAHGLVRQWASSCGALRAALRRQLERGAALESALESGSRPTYREIRAWCVGDGAIQLAFPELVTGEKTEAEDLLPSVRAHAAALRALISRIAMRPDPDKERAERIRELRRRHRGCKIVAFSTYEQTVETLYRRLLRDGGVCLLCSAGAKVAGGPLSRAEAVSRFAPEANRVPPPREAERVELLLTTDLLSEGVNLQDASVVVHLDLPWTPARLEQRVGRVARLGSSHRRVAVYAIRPPAAADRLLGVERALTEKLAAAGRTVGIAGSIVPGRIGCEVPIGVPHHVAAARATIASWRCVDGRSIAGPDLCGRAPSGQPMSERPLCAAVWAAVDGFLAVCAAAHGGPAVLVASIDGVGTATDAAEIVARAADLANGRDAPVEWVACNRALAAIRAWALARRAARDAGIDHGAEARVRRRILLRIAGIVRIAPYHRRPLIATLATEARDAAVAPSGLGVERLLESLADLALPDEQWLRAVAEVHSGTGGSACSGGEDSVGGTPLALILFRAQPAFNYRELSVPERRAAAVGGCVSEIAAGAACTASAAHVVGRAGGADIAGPAYVDRAHPASLGAWPFVEIVCVEVAPMSGAGSRIALSPWVDGGIGYRSTSPCHETSFG